MSIHRTWRCFSWLLVLLWQWSQGGASIAANTTMETSLGAGAPKLAAVAVSAAGEAVREQRPPPLVRREDHLSDTAMVAGFINQTQQSLAEEGEEAEEAGLAGLAADDARNIARTKELYETRGFMRVVVLKGDGQSIETDVGEKIFNDMFYLCPVVMYQRNSKVNAVYVRTKRPTEKGGFNAYKAFTQTWPASTHKLNRDFRIYDTMEKAENDMARKTPAGGWAFCPSDTRPDVGFPSTCSSKLDKSAKNKDLGDNFFTMPGGRYFMRGLGGDGASLSIWTLPNCISPVGFKDKTKQLMGTMKDIVGKTISAVDTQLDKITEEEKASSKKMTEESNKINAGIKMANQLLAKLEKVVDERQKTEIKGMKGMEGFTEEVEGNEREAQKESIKRFAAEKAGYEKVSGVLANTNTRAEEVRKEVQENQRQAEAYDDKLKKQRNQLEADLETVQTEIYSQVSAITADLLGLIPEVKGNGALNKQDAGRHRKEHEVFQKEVRTSVGALVDAVKKSQDAFEVMQNSDLPYLSQQIRGDADERMKSLERIGQQAHSLGADSRSAMYALDTELKLLDSSVKNLQEVQKQTIAKEESVRKQLAKRVETAVQPAGVALQDRLRGAAEREHEVTQISGKSNAAIEGGLGRLEADFKSQMSGATEAAQRIARRMQRHKANVNRELSAPEQVRQTDWTKVNSLSSDLTAKRNYLQQRIQQRRQQRQAGQGPQRQPRQGPQRQAGRGPQRRAGRGQRR